MSRYQGYSDPLEVLIDILNEMREIKELLKPKDPKEDESKEQGGNEDDNKSQATTTRKRSDRGSSNNAK